MENSNAIVEKLNIPKQFVCTETQDKRWRKIFGNTLSHTIRMLLDEEAQAVELEIATRQDKLRQRRLLRKTTQ